MKDSAYQGLSPNLTDSYGYLFVYANGENSSYNALQIQFRHQETNRLQVLASYTWAHALDNGSSDFESVAGYQDNYKADSDNDIRHIFSSAIHYTPQGLMGTRFLRGLTGGWSLDSIAQLQTSPPFSVYSNNPVTDPNLYNTYAEVVPGVPNGHFKPRCSLWKAVEPGRLRFRSGNSQWNKPAKWISSLRSADAMGFVRQSELALVGTRFYDLQSRCV